MVRHLVGSTQNEPHLTWSLAMLNHVRAMLHWRKSLPPDNPPDPTEVTDMQARYDESLELAEGEHAEHPPTKYYRDVYILFRRIRDYHVIIPRYIGTVPGHRSGVPSTGTHYGYRHPFLWSSAGTFGSGGVFLKNNPRRGVWCLVRQVDGLFNPVERSETVCAAVATLNDRLLGWRTTTR